LTRQGGEEEILFGFWPQTQKKKSLRKKKKKGGKGGAPLLSQEKATFFPLSGKKKKKKSLKEGKRWERDNSSLNFISRHRKTMGDSPSSYAAMEKKGRGKRLGAVSIRLRRKNVKKIEAAGAAVVARERKGERSFRAKEKKTGGSSSLPEGGRKASTTPSSASTSSWKESGTRKRGKRVLHPKTFRLLS